mgnify:CR=1 FL=1|tara:strand:+ start:4664 stop:5143 length:480 start_codon:yes stop_codon:yes gene_type:complete
MLSIKDNSRFFKKALKIKSDRVQSAIQIALADASAFQIDAIRERTEQRGKDVKNRPFKPYSKSYIQAKRKRTNDPSNQDTSPKNFVDLNFTGRMFSALTFTLRPSRGVLFFKTAQQAKKAFIHNTGKGRMPKREFFGVSEIEQKKINAIISKSIKKALA